MLRASAADAAARKRQMCPCGTPYLTLGQHLRRSPDCKVYHDFVQVVQHESGDEEVQAVVAAEAKLARKLHSDRLQADIASDLCELRMEDGLNHQNIHRLKGVVQRWYDLAVSDAYRRLLPLLRDDVKYDDVRAALATELFAGIETSAKELTAAKKAVPMVEPREVVLSEGGGPRDVVVSCSMVELLRRKLEFDADFRKAVVAKSEELKRGEHWQQQADDIDDVLDGVAARFHPGIHRPAGEDEAADLRIPFLGYADDVEVRARTFEGASHRRAPRSAAAVACATSPARLLTSRAPAPQVNNPLQPAAGKHKMMGVQAAVLALPAEKRFEQDNLLLPVMCRASVYKKYGMARVLCGVDSNGAMHSEPNFAADVRALESGEEWVHIPDDVHGGRRWWRLRAPLLLWTADAPAAGSRRRNRHKP